MESNNGSTALVPLHVMTPREVDPAAFFSKAQIDLIRREIAPKITDDEFQVFLFQCARTGLDPFSRQIYAIPRSGKMTIQTGIDGFRLIAERTRRYAPGPETTYEYDSANNVRKATAYVKKQTTDGTWHVVSASAYYAEYVVEYNGKPSGLWAKPHIMLGKCAESLALRKAFPAEMSGLYTADEMGQADVVTYEPPKAAPAPKAEMPKLASAPAPAAQRRLQIDIGNEPPAAPAAAPVNNEVDERALRINKICMMKPPEGLGWTKAGSKGWLKKRFGVDSTGALSEQQKRDAEVLLLARMMGDNEHTYREHVELFSSQGRCQADPPPAHDEDGVVDDDMEMP